MRKFIIPVIVALSITTSFSHAAKMTTSVTDIDGEKIRAVRIEGMIKTGDADKLDRLIERYDDTKYPVEIVVLNSPGGDVDESYDLADRVIDNDIATIVLPNEKCVSACVAVYAAGSERILYPDSIVGVHRAHTRNGDTDNAKSASVAMMAIYKDLDVPKSVRYKMIETPPDKVYYLTIAEKKAFSTMQDQFEETIPTSGQALTDWILNDSNPITATGNYSH